MHGTRDAPERSNILGVFGLSIFTREPDLEDIFSQYGNLQRVTVVYDRRHQRSRGFAFVYFETEDEAERARTETNGMNINGRAVRVDYSVTHRPHTPTPGEYMGEKRADGGRGGGRYGGRDRDRRSRRRSRSRSPYYNRRRRYSYRSRSRSRSWSR
ncbi:RNA-binding domain-containing protein [Lichtheimia hyalospora FSU 10163]|nr:RNA-binding domain-containing protein [Lichtheimia hyalospora FSU 10163]